MTVGNINSLETYFRKNHRKPVKEKDDDDEPDEGEYKESLKKAIIARHPIHWHWIASDMYHLCCLFAHSLNLVLRMDGDLMEAILTETMRLLESTSMLAKVDMETNDADAVEKENWLKDYAKEIAESLIWVLGKLAKTLMMQASKKEDEKKEGEEEKKDRKKQEAEERN